MKLGMTFKWRNQEIRDKVSWKVGINGAKEIKYKV